MKIFLSYRRGDTAGYAGRLADGLAERFGAPQIFRDVDSIPAGTDFVEAMQAAVAGCDVLVAVIGREWLTATDAAGKRRLDDPEDFVRLEIAAALDHDIRVLPVLVEGAVMPPAKLLPPPLAPLSHQNALEVSDSRWDYDLGRLVQAIDPDTQLPMAVGRTRRRWTGLAVGAVAALVVVAIAAILVGGGGGGGATPSVRFIRPASRVIGYPETVEIEAVNLPPGTVWYVTQTEGVPDYQPDSPPERVGDRWTGEVYAGDRDEPGERYVLHVVVANQAADRAFHEYLDRSATAGYPGFAHLPDGARVVESIVVTRR
jgi:hypothetical protein